MYSMKSRVRYSEADSGQKMTFQALTNYLQDCCIFQSEDLWNWRGLFEGACTGMVFGILADCGRTAAGSWRKK